MRGDSGSEPAPPMSPSEAPVASSTAQEHPKPMLDVHAPHETAHTGKDFFIHIATISVGLLIAVSLEQIVESIHHRHQRIELEAPLLEEARQNAESIRGDYAASDAELNWLFSLQLDVQSMLAAHPRLVYRPQ